VLRALVITTLIAALFTAFAQGKSDTAVIRHHLDLSESFENTNLDSSLHHAEQALAISLRTGLAAWAAEGYNAVGIALERKGQLDEAIRSYRQAMRLYDSLGAQRQVAGCMVNVGLSYRLKGEMDSAVKYNELALQISRAEKLHRLEAYVLHNIGSVYETRQYWYTALDYYLQSLELKTQYGTEEDHAYTLYNIGNIYFELKLADKAISFYKRALDASADDDSITVGDVHYAIANVYSTILSMHDSAMTLYRKALIVRSKIGYAQGIAEALLGIGETWRHLGRADSAVVYVRRAHDVLLDSEMYSDIASTYLALARSYSALRQWPIAIALADSGIEAARTVESRRTEMSLYQLLADIHRERGDWKPAAEYMTRYSALKDSVLNEEIATRVLDLETRYRSAQKDKAIAEQALELERQELRLVKRNRQLLLMIGGTAVLVIMMLMMWGVFATRRRLMKQEVMTMKREGEVRLLEAIAEGEEIERGRLARELHDGVSGMLSAAKLSVGSLRQVPGVEVNESFRQANALLEDTARELRQVSHNLMPEHLRQIGLIGSLEQYLETMERTGNIRFHLQHYGMEKRLDRKTELLLYRVIQELVHNIMKHARATEALVQLNRNHRLMQVTIEDNGAGMPATDATDGAGLESIRTRLQSLYGKLDIESKTGEGTSVYLELLLPEESVS